MKRSENLKKAVLIIFVVTMVTTVQTLAQLNYKTTWVANSGGTWETFTQMYMLGSQVSKAGIVCGVTTWDEGGRGLGVYNATDGTVLNTEWTDRGAGICVGVNLNFVYTASREGNIVKRPLSNTISSIRSIKIPGIIHTSRDPYALSFDAETSDIYRNQIGVTGVNANDFYVVAAVYQSNKVYVYDADLNFLREININRAFYAAPDENGNVWVIQGADNDNACKVLEFNTSGLPTGKEITGLSDPRSLQINSEGVLVIGDNGANNKVFFYDISAEPVLIKTFGQQGGIGAGIPGEVKPDKFNGIIHAGTDSLNNLYVITNREGALIRKFSPDNELLWQKYGLAFVDMACADPENENFTYTSEEKYLMDYSKENGEEHNYVACLIDADKYPEDPRINQSLDGGVWIRYIDGKKFMFVGQMYSDFIFIYRFNAATDGEIAIPSGAIMNHVSSQWGLTEWPPHQPKLGSFIWRDKNGNGRFEADEYESVPYEISLGNVDEIGNVYLRGSLDYFECLGLDDMGNPVYSFKNKVFQAIPDDFYLFKKAVYDNKCDVMFITGNSHDASNEYNVGPVFAAYPDWSKGNRKAAWIKEHNAQYEGFAAKSDYFFAAYSFQLNDCGIDVFKTSDGSKVGTFGTQQLDEFGWIDIPWGLIAEQRSNGEYLVFREDDYFAKIVIQRWNPYSNDADNPTKPSDLQLVSTTSSSVTISFKKATDITGLLGYFIYANGIRNNKIAVWDTLYTLTGLLPDTDYDIAVVAADFAGHETSSDIIHVKTLLADNIKPTTPSGITALEILHTSISLCWNESTDNVETIGYNIFLDDNKINYKLIADTMFIFTGLMPDNQYKIKLVAYDYAGNISDTSATFVVTTLADVEAPGTPTMISTTQVSSSEIAVIWSVSTDNVGIESYNIYHNGELLREEIPAHEYLGIPVDGDFMNYKITGLEPNTTYNLSIQAHDKSGNASAISNTITNTTESGWSRLLDIEESDMTHMGHNFYYGSSTDASGFVAGFMKQPGYVEWTVDLPLDTLYRFITRYTTMENFPYPMQIDVNQEKVAEFTLRKLPGMDWCCFHNDPGYVSARLKAGKSIIRLSSFAQYAPNLDLLKIMITAPFVPVASISLDSTSITLMINETYQLKTTVLPLNADIKSVKFSSSSNAIVSVNATGLITAKSEGTATITVTTDDGGKTATCLVTVKNAVGISKNSMNNLIRIYPNPATDFVTIDLGNNSDNFQARIQIVDLLGKQVYDSGALLQMTALRINSSQFKKGVYFVNIIKGSSIICRKLIIQ